MFNSLNLLQNRYRDRYRYRKQYIEVIWKNAFKQGRNLKKTHFVRDTIRPCLHAGLLIICTFELIMWDTVHRCV